MNKNKYYIVIRGKNGINVFRDWESCKSEVQGISKSVYRSFKQKDKAITYMQEKLKEIYNMKPKEIEQLIHKHMNVSKEDISPFNVNEKKNVKLYLYARSQQDHPKRIGGYKGILIWDGLEKRFEKTKEQTDNVSLLIEGVVEGINYLNEPCSIEIITNAPFGFQKLHKLHKFTNHMNYSELAELQKIIHSNKHDITSVSYNKSLLPKSITRISLLMEDLLP